MAFFDKCHMAYNVMDYGNMGIKGSVSIRQNNSRVFELFHRSKIFKNLQKLKYQYFLCILGEHPLSNENELSYVFLPIALLHQYHRIKMFKWYLMIIMPFLFCKFAHKTSKPKICERDLKIIRTFKLLFVCS